MGDCVVIETRSIIRRNVEIGSNVKLHRGSNIGSDVFISSYTLVGENSEICSNSRIDRFCSIENNVKIGHSVTIGSNNQIGSESIILSHVETENDVIIGKRVRINSHAKIHSGAGIGDDSFLGRHSTVSGNIGSKTFISEYCTVDNATINNSAIILNNITIPNGETIKENGVAIRSPSSHEMFNNAILANYLHSISPHQ